MRKNRIPFLLLCLAVTFATLAKPINENQARGIATRFMAGHSLPSGSLRLAHKAPGLKASPSADDMAYYVFNAPQGGYVIIAGDDQAPAVLGYSERGTFDANDVPEAMQELLEGYASQISALSNNGQAVKLQSSGPAIQPMVTAQWSQNEPYNTMLPMMSDGSQAVAGCVATAMAQLLYYWKQPTQVLSTLPEYTTQTYGIYMPALEPVDFNWEAMQDTYLNNDIESEGAQAAARLTLYCAQALKMNFLYGTSGANSNHIPNVLSTYFGYKSTAHCEYRENFSTQGWADFIYSELAANRPVIYSGSKASSGHAFICDGYDGEGMFHINWGWNGQSNGYFLLNVLNPDHQGTGSASEAYGYVYGQYTVCGIEPGQSANECVITSGDVALNSAVTTRVSSNANFKATVTGRFYNYTTQTIGVKYGWGLYQDEELISVLYNSYIMQLPSGYFMSTKAQELSFGKNITSGTYRIVPIYSEYDYFTTNWRPCVGADINFIEVTIDGDNCTITGHGTAGERDYTVHDITANGSMHHGRPVDLTVNITNNGYSHNDLLHLFVDGAFYSTAYLDLDHNETSDILFRFLPTAAGVYTCSFSFNQDGSDPIAQTTISIEQMPAANLTVGAEVLNITDSQEYIVTSDKFSVKLTITNDGPEIYHDDITVKLYKNLDGTYGSNTQVLNQFAHILPDQTIEMQFDLDNVINGWDYFAAVCCYSEGRQSIIHITPHYTIMFPEVPQVMAGDVNGDREVSIKDVSALIDYLLTGDEDGIVMANADVNQIGGITIADVSALIDMLLDN